MNIIQKALALQEIYVAWSGSAPSNSSTITSTYLDGNDGDFPRMVRTDEDTGNTIDVTQLRADFDALDDSTIETLRVSKIKAEAGRIINARYPEWKQRNMTARGLELVREEQVNGSLTTEETAEIGDIEAVWAWIKSIRTTSDQAETDETLLHLISWPE